MLKDTVVTHEQVANSSKTVTIPNVCVAMDVK